MLGQLFFATGPQVCIEALQGYPVRHKADPRFKVEDPRSSAEEFLDLLRGYSHLKMLLGIERYPAKRAIETRIESAIDHFLR
jgi:TetR/AcrR family transcriptional repressor of mexJK operon